MIEERWKPNATVAAVIERNGAFLLVEEDTFDGIRLNNPAGHLDPSESPYQACIRETLEEAAYDFTPTALVGIYLNRFTASRTGRDVTYLRFAFSGDLGQFYPERSLDTGILRTVWMTADELRECPQRLRSPIVMQSIEDYLAGKRFPMDIISVHPSVERKA